MRCACNRFTKKVDIGSYECKCGLIVESDEEGLLGSDGNIYIAVNNKLVLKPKEEIKMAFLKTSSTEAGGFGPLTPGEYEVVISEAKISTSETSGNEVLKLTLTVRSNVDQPHKKRKVFDNLAVTEKAMFKFHNLSMALFGEGTEFASLAEFKKAVTNQCVRVLIKTEKNTYQGQTKDVDRVVTYKLSEADGGGEGNGDPFEDDGRPIDISEDDLPF